MSYVSGARNMKVGYQGGYDNPTNQITTPIDCADRMKNGVINRLHKLLLMRAGTNRVET